jgi:uncharacterized protein YycO
MIISNNVVNSMKPGDIIQYHMVNIDPIWNVYYWSHTMMYIGNDTVIHTQGAPVQTANIYEYFNGFPNIVNYVVLRPNGLSQSQIDSAINFAKAQIGEPYDMWSILRLTKQLDPPPSHPGFGFYCTELIWASYFQAGLDLDSNHVGMVNPMEIYMNRRVNIVYILSRWQVWLPWLRLY